MMKLFLSAAVAITLAVLPRVNAGPGTSPTNSDSTAISNGSVVARGKGFEIRRREMDQVLATATAKNPEDKLPPDAELHALTHLIEIRLVLQKANDTEKAEGKSIIDVNFTNIVNTLGDKFERQLKATGMTADELRLMLFQEDAAQTSLTRQLGIHVTDADAKKFFDEHPGAYDKPEMARIRELVLLTTTDWTRSDAPPLPDAVIEAKHKLIFDLHNRILAGEDFAALARQYNEHPLSKDYSDELTFIRGQMEISDLVFSMKTNQVSDVVTNESNYCIFQLLEIIPAKTTGFADVADKLKHLLTGAQKRRLAPAYIKQLWKEADVEILDAKLKEAMAANEAEAAAAAKARAEFVARQTAEATNRPPAKP